MIIERFLYNCDTLDGCPAPIDSNGLLYSPDSLRASERYRELLIGIEAFPFLSGGVILAEGGSGKTTFLQQVAESIGEGAKVFRLGDYVNDAKGLRDEVDSFIDLRSGNGDSYLLFDALDENSEISGPLVRLVENNASRENVHIWVASRNISQIARLGDIEKTKQCYSLAPFSFENIRALAENAGVNADTFYAEAKKRGLLSLCSKPMGCTGLIEAFKANKSSLSGMNIRTLWRSMVDKLLDQTADKMPSARFALPELFRAAEWIALSLSLSGKQHVWTIGIQSECPDTCVSLDSLVDAEMNLPRDLLLETLRRGLFAPEKDGKTRLAHESYKDFLAATAFTEFALHPHWRNFFLSENRRFVFPSRQEILGWYALENEEVRRHLLDNAPEILLSSRELVDMVGAKTLCDAVLKRVCAHDYGWDKQRELKLHNLQSTEMTAFVSEELRKPNISDDAFDFLADVVKACEFNDAALVSLFTGVVADRSRPLRQRHDASYVLQTAKLAEKDFVQLKTLLPLSEADDDPFSTIRGAILQICWPEHLSETEIDELASQPFTHSYGSYEAFFDTLPDELVKRDNPELALLWLRWANERLTDDAVHHEPVAKRIFTACWHWACYSESIRHELTKGWKDAALNHDTPFAWDEHAADCSYFSKAWFNQNTKHRQAIAQLVVEQGSQETCSYLIRSYGRCPLLFEGDFLWIQERLVDSAQNPSAELWWRLAEQCLNPGWTIDTAQLNTFHGIRPDLMPDTVETILAAREKRHKDFAKTERGWETAARKRQKRERDAENKLFQSIQGFLAQDTALIPAINFLGLSDRLMRLEDGDWSSLRLYDAPVWEKLSETEKETMVALANRFLLECENSSPDDKYVNYAHAVITAMALIRHHDLLSFETLPEAAWERNGAELLRIAGFGNSDSGGNISTLLLDALAKHEAAATVALKKNIHRDLQQDTLYFSALHEWGDRLTAKQEAAVMEIVRSENDHPERQCALLEALHGIGRDREAKTFLAEMFPPGNLMSHPESAFHRLRGLAFALSPKVYIDSLLKTLHEQAWAKTFIETAWDCGSRGAYGAALGTFVLDNCSSEEFAKFYAWTHGVYPAKDEPKHGYTYSPTVIDHIHDWRSCILGVLKKPDCQNGIDVLEAVFKRLPGEEWIKRLLSEAREVNFTQQPPVVSPRNLKDLIRREEARVINNGADLMELVRDAIRKYETYLQEGTNGCPAIMNLWDKHKDGSLAPRDEETLTDDLKRYLDLTLTKRVVINREVQIRRKLCEGGEPGSRTDLWVQASNADGHTLTLCIEVKCSWNESAKHALETQLFKKYMGEGRASHGILLLGWYDCKGEDKKNASKTLKNVWKNRDVATSELAQQAARYTNILTTIINCSVN